MKQERGLVLGLDPLHTVDEFSAAYGDHLRSLIELAWRRALAVYLPDPGEWDYRDRLLMEFAEKRVIAEVDCGYALPALPLDLGSSAEPFPQPYASCEDETEERRPRWRDLPMPELKGQVLQACCIVGSSAAACGERAKEDRGASDAWLAGLEFHFSTDCVGIAISTAEPEEWRVDRGVCPWPWPETVVRREWIRCE